MIILGIDPGYAIVGFGVIEKTARETKVIDYGVIETDKSLKMSVRLNKIYDGLEYLIKKYTSILNNANNEKLIDIVNTLKDYKY